MTDRRDGRNEAVSQCPLWETMVDLTYDELEPARADEVRAHIAQCPACTEAFKELLVFLKMADGLPGGPVCPSPAVEERLKAEVLMRRPHFRRLLDWVRGVAMSPLPAYQVLSIAAILAIIFQLLVPGTPERLKSLVVHADHPAECRPGAGGQHAGVLGAGSFPGVFVAPPSAGDLENTPSPTPGSR